MSPISFHFIFIRGLSFLDSFFELHLSILFLCVYFILIQYHYYMHTTLPIKFMLSKTEPYQLTIPIIIVNTDNIIILIPDPRISLMRTLPSSNSHPKIMPLQQSPPILHRTHKEGKHSAPIILTSNSLYYMDTRNNMTSAEHGKPLNRKKISLQTKRKSTKSSRSIDEDRSCVVATPSIYSFFVLRFSIHFSLLFHPLPRLNRFLPLNPQ